MALIASCNGNPAKVSELSLSLGKAGQVSRAHMQDTTDGSKKVWIETVRSYRLEFLRKSESGRLVFVLKMYLRKSANSERPVNSLPDAYLTEAEVSVRPIILIPELELNIEVITKGWLWKRKTTYFASVGAPDKVSERAGKDWKTVEPFYLERVYIPKPELEPRFWQEAAERNAHELKRGAIFALNTTEKGQALLKSLLHPTKK